MKSPYPWFGGKALVAEAVWERFGDVQNYVEPFFGGGAMLLNRPAWHTGCTETVNDINAWLTNFWRAVKADPDAVAYYADWPVNEIDLAARRDWLFAQKGDVAKMETDPDWYDAKLAGVWVWGVCSTIGNSWNPKSTHLGNAGRGVHRAGAHLGNAGMGVHRAGAHLGAGMGATRLETLTEYFRALQARLERVRVLCGDWKRVTSDTVTVHNGLTGMFLDPPYIDGCCTDVYEEHNGDVRAEVREYAIANGDRMRIALCCYEGEHEMPATWECYRWKAAGGYASQGDGKNENCKRETIWFSPMCLSVDLFEGIDL
jgi:site-specific DNA-adenine methylase